MKIRLFTFAALALLSSLSHADDLTQNKLGKQNIDEQNLIETTRKIVDSVGFVDIDAQSRSFLSTAVLGKNLKDPRLILKISRDFRKYNTRTDALFLANKKAEHKKQFKKRIEGRERLNKLHEDLREQEYQNSLEVKRIHDEYNASKNK